MSEKWKVAGTPIELPKAGATKIERRPGGWLLVTAPDGSRQRIALSESKGKLSASLGGVLYQGDVLQKTREGAGGGASDADLTAQFPGKVRRILVQPDQSVKAGDTLILVEAMKMEFAVKAPFAAKIKKVLVQEGGLLKPGDRYFDLEEIKSK